MHHQIASDTNRIFSSRISGQKLDPVKKGHYFHSSGSSSRVQNWVHFLSSRSGFPFTKLLRKTFCALSHFRHFLFRAQPDGLDSVKLRLVSPPLFQHPVSGFPSPSSQGQIGTTLHTGPIPSSPRQLTAPVMSEIILPRVTGYLKPLISHCPSHSFPSSFFQSEDSSPTLLLKSRRTCLSKYHSRERK